MDWLLYLITLAIFGLIVGGFARLALPGKDPMTISQTIAVGLAGSFVAGIIVYAISGGSEAPGFLASLVFSTLIVYFIRRRRGGGLIDPGVPGGRDRR